MEADFDALDPREVTRRLHALRNAFDRVLPADNAKDCREKYDPKAFEDLYRQTEDCIAILVKAAPFGHKDRTWIDAQTCADGLFSAFGADFIPRLNRAIEETLPVPEVTADRAMALDLSIRSHSPVAAKLFQLLAARCKDLTGHGAPLKWRADLERRLSNLVRLYQGQINDILTSPDPPDLRGLSADLLRMDVLYWALQDLGIHTVADVLEKNEKVTARLIMDSASDAVDRFLQRPDNLNRFDLGIVLTAIDDLIAVMARVLEHHERDMEGPHDGFLESRGRESITRFVVAMGKLMVMMFRDLSDQAASGELVYETAEINLTKIERIHEFCQLADPMTNGRVHAAADRTIRERSKILFKDLQQAAQGRSAGDVVKVLKRLEQTLTRLALAPPANTVDKHA